MLLWWASSLKLNTELLLDARGGIHMQMALGNLHTAVLTFLDPQERRPGGFTAQYNLVSPKARQAICDVFVKSEKSLGKGRRSEEASERQAGRERQSTVASPVDASQTFSSS
jgi:hypothetical protein